MLVFKEISSKDEIKELSKIILESSDNYNQYFNPFDFNYESLSKIISKKQKDLYYIILFKNHIIGFFMLRGFDLGYKVPSYGVWISYKFKKMGLATLSLNYCISLLKILSINKIMLKVHPKNLVAKKLYEKNGFKFSHIDESNKNLIYYKKINE